MESNRPVRILTVCTGNICRSPVAERLLQAGLDQILPDVFEVRSAGTRALVDEPMQPQSAEIVRTYGGFPDGFLSRQLTAKILRESDLVLTMSSNHRGEVLQLDASLLKRTFTIREFARMLDVVAKRGEGAAPTSDPASFWRELPRLAASVRHLALTHEPGENDVVDPFRRAPEVYREMEDQLAPAILTILRFARVTSGA